MKKKSFLLFSILSKVDHYTVKNLKATLINVKKLNIFRNSTFYVTLERYRPRQTRILSSRLDY